jgi:hypothetical protein
MGRRRRSEQQDQELVQGGRPAARLPEQWSEIDPAELEHRHRQAQLLVARGHGALQWERSHGEL